LVVAAIVFAVSWGLTTHGKYSDTGDEPHYLLVCESLRVDGDLAVGNNYERGDGAMFGAGGLQREAHARLDRSGRLLPVHDIGVPVALLPAYVAATKLATLPSDALLQRFRMNRGLFAYSLVSLVIIGLVSAGAAVTMTALLHQGTSPLTSAAIVLIAFLSPPVLDNSFVVFPEPFALVIVACTVARSSVSREAWRWPDSLLLLALGALPWFHRKYLLLAVALAVLLVWQRRLAWRQLTAGARARQCVVFTALPLALGLWTLHVWGNLSGPIALDGLPLSWSTLKRGLAGLFIDRENGLFWWAPVYIVLPAGWWLRRATVGAWLLPVASLVIPCAAHDQWWGGFSPAGRFLMPLVPIFCLVAAAASAQRTLRRAMLTLLLPGIAIAAYGWQHPRAFWPRGDGVNRVLQPLLAPLGASDRWLPSFRTDPDAWTAAVWVVAALVVLNVALVLAASKRPAARIVQE
jgi:hypothetical protein